MCLYVWGRLCQGGSGGPTHYCVDPRDWTWVDRLGGTSTNWAVCLESLRTDHLRGLRMKLSSKGLTIWGSALSSGGRGSVHFTLYVCVFNRSPHKNLVSYSSLRCYLYTISCPYRNFWTDLQGSFRWRFMGEGTGWPKEAYYSWLLGILLSSHLVFT